MNAAQKRLLPIVMKELHQKHAGPAGLACALVKTATTPVDRLERAEHGLRALEGMPRYAEAVSLTRSGAEVAGTTASRARMLAAGLEAMALSPSLVAAGLYAACPRGQEVPLARLLLEKTQTPHEGLAQAVLRSRSLSEASKHEMFSRFLDQIEPKDDFRGMASAAEGLVSGSLGFSAQKEAARLALRECGKAAPSAEEQAWCQVGSQLVESVGPKLGARMARTILSDLAHGHDDRLGEALLAKASGTERKVVARILGEG